MTRWLGCLPLLLSLGTLPSAMAALTASDYRQQGLRYRDQEQYPAAIAALQQAVALDPKDLSGRVMLGWTYHRAGQGAAAADTLVRVLVRDPKQVPALNALGIVYLVNGDPTAAVVVHTWAALLKPENEIAYYNMSLALHQLKQYNWAIATAELAADLEPTNPHPLVALAIAYWDNGAITLAKQAFAAAINLDPRYRDPGFLDYLNEAGFSAAQIRQSDQVLRHLNRP
ncbi:tetratricopeptide repeat protein [Neosynechococcus sphagnicola]|uniref:tetratricopeptide repeat protein n=1 Tax=Neosynechococcus sphagnicola TaxID=1501145 RepID=UPI00056874A6|nr:tetratricopeptide repeat protein [Neosynechococcus sphagnicola]